MKAAFSFTLINERGLSAKLWNFFTNHAFKNLHHIEDYWRNLISSNLSSIQAMLRHRAFAAPNFTLSSACKSVDISWTRNFCSLFRRLFLATKINFHSLSIFVFFRGSEKKVSSWFLVVSQARCSDHRAVVAGSGWGNFPLSVTRNKNHFHDANLFLLAYPEVF